MLEDEELIVHKYETHGIRLKDSMGDDYYSEEKIKELINKHRRTGQASVEKKFGKKPSRII